MIVGGVGHSLLGQAIERTEGGLNAKLAAVVDPHGRAIAVAPASGTSTRDEKSHRLLAFV